MSAEDDEQAYKIIVVCLPASDIEITGTGRMTRKALALRTRIAETIAQAKMEQREADAKIADARGERVSPDSYGSAYERSTAWEIAALIRARGTT